MTLFIVTRNKKLKNSMTFFTQQTLLDEQNASLPRTMGAPRNTLYSFIITSDEVESILLSLPTGKASGPDSINNKILKDFAHPLSTPLKDLFNFSLEKGQVPGSKLIIPLAYEVCRGYIVFAFSVFVCACLLTLFCQRFLGNYLTWDFEIWYKH